MSKKKRKPVNVVVETKDDNVIIINPNKIKVRGIMPPPQVKHKSNKTYNRKAKHKEPFRPLPFAA